MIVLYSKIVALKQQEEKLKKLVDKIQYEQNIIKKQKQEIRHLNRRSVEK